MSMRPRTLAWEEATLRDTLTSLDLHRRIVALGFPSTSEVVVRSPTSLSDSSNPVVLERTFMRCVLWRVYLRLLPFPFSGSSMDVILNNWCEALFQQRAWYATTKQRFLQERDARLQGVPGEDIITMDIVRSYKAADATVPNDMLKSVLELWASLHPKYGYQQGMHEMCGTCLQMLHQAAASMYDSGSTPIAVTQCCNPTYFEADTYTLFNALMEDLRFAEMYGPQSSPSARTSSLPPLLAALCHHVSDVLLPRSNPALHSHLNSMGLTANSYLYLPRWFCTLFLREVSTSQALVLWDGLFACYYHNSVATRGPVTIARSCALPADASASPNGTSSPKGSFRGAAEFAASLLSGSGSSGNSVSNVQQQGSLAPVHDALCGVAVALLGAIEEDLMVQHDDFNVLKKITRSPTVPPTSDVTALLLSGLNLVDAPVLHDLPASLSHRGSARRGCGSPTVASPPLAEADELIVRLRESAILLNGVVDVLEGLLSSGEKHSSSTSSAIGASVAQLKMIQSRLMTPQLPHRGSSAALREREGSARLSSGSAH